MSASSDSVSVEREVKASAEKVWEMVSDVTRMGEWSPETVRATWVKPAAGPKLGAKFRGSNRRSWHRWTTTSEVTGCEPGREFRFLVTSGPFTVAEWSYRIEPTEDGCRVTETWDDRRNLLVKIAGIPVSGVVDRAAHNRAGMEETLRRLAEAAESEA